MVHGALLLLMLEAVHRTSFHHQPEAQHPKSSAIHKLPADYPIYSSVSDQTADIVPGRFRARNGLVRCNKFWAFGVLLSRVQLVEQRLRPLQIERVEAFGEPPVDRSELEAGSAAIQ